MAHAKHSDGEIYLSNRWKGQLDVVTSEETLRQ